MATVYPVACCCCSMRSTVGMNRWHEPVGMNLSHPMVAEPFFDVLTGKRTAHPKSSPVNPFLEEPSACRCSRSMMWADQRKDNQLQFLPEWRFTPIRYTITRGRQPRIAPRIVGPQPTKSRQLLTTNELSEICCFQCCRRRQSLHQWHHSLPKELSQSNLSRVSHGIAALASLPSEPAATSCAGCLPPAQKPNGAWAFSVRLRPEGPREDEAHDAPVVRCSLHIRRFQLPAAAAQEGLRRRLLLRHQLLQGGRRLLLEVRAQP